MTTRFSLPAPIDRLLRRVIVTAGCLLMMAALLPNAAPGQSLDYPATRSVDSVDVYHGTRVHDPYQWLEDLDSEATADWVQRQNDVTFGYLEDIPEREPLRQRLTELWNYPKMGVPQRRGDRVFFSRNDGLQDQSVVYVRSSDDANGNEARVLLNPNTWSEDGTVALSAFSPSPDGQYVAYGTSESGSDWKTLHVLNVASGETMRDTIRWVKFSSPTWTKDGEGFFYGRYPEPKEGEAYEAQTTGQSIYYHELGTDQSDDRLIYERPDNPKLGFSLDVTHDGRYLVVEAREGTSDKSEVYLKDLQAESANGIDEGEFTPLIEGFDAQYTVRGSRGSTFFVETNLDAPTGRVVAVDADDPARENWKTIVSEREDAVLKDADLIGGKLVVRSLSDVKARLDVYELDGERTSRVELPTIGSVGSVNGSPDRSEFYYAFTSFTYPTTIYRYDLETGTSQTVFRPDVEVDADRYIVQQVFYESLDGTDIPMFVVHRKGLELDGSNPTYLYGYGGFNITVTPSFSPRTMSWLEMGGVYAVPNLRGGGAYGEAWHEAGMLENKQTVFDDFAAAAQFLIDEGYTSTPKLAIGGGSNGGLLTGASLTQRPDLFGAVVVRVGVLDMLRYHKFTIGWAWVPEYGSSEDPEQFEYLIEYSPLHNLVPGASYPPTLITTADTDDRVVPAHSYKFAAALQKAQGGEAPTLLRVETKAGHGGGKPTSKEIEAAADIWAFLVEELEMETPGLSAAPDRSTPAGSSDPSTPDAGNETDSGS